MHKEKNNVIDNKFQEISKIGGREDTIVSSEINETLEPKDKTETLFGKIHDIFATTGIKVKISNSESGFDDKNMSLSLNKDTIKNNFSKISAFIAMILGPVSAFGQSIGTLEQGHLFINRGVIAILMGILGVSGYGIKKIVEKIKKPEFEKKLGDKFKKMKGTKDKDEKEKIKKEIVIGFMGDLPQEMSEESSDLVIEDKKDFDKSVELKISNGKFIDEIFASISEIFSLIQKGEGAYQDIHEVEKTKDTGLSLINKLVNDIQNNYNQLDEKYTIQLQSPNQKESNLYKKQLLFEKKKLSYMLSYIKNTRKNFLVYIQNMKNKIIQNTDINKLQGDNIIIKELDALQKKLKALMDKQQTLDPEDFKKQLDEIDNTLSEKIDDAEKAGVIVNDSLYELSTDKFHLMLDKKGIYTYPEKISYKINNRWKEVSLYPGMGAQIWITPNKEIKINIIDGKKIVATEILDVKNEDFFMHTSGESLLEYMKNKGREKGQGEKKDTNDKDDGAADILPEGSEIVLEEIGTTTMEVLSDINKGTYKLLGRNVFIDHDAIEQQQIQIHKEYFDGGEYLGIRFKLCDNYRKNAITLLGKCTDVPKSEISYNFENASGVKKYVNCPVIRFNIIAGNTTVPVLISKSSSTASMYGEVKILLKKGVNYDKATIKEVFAEVAKKLGIQKHIQAVDENAKKTLHDTLEKIRNEKQKFSGDDEKVNQEYDTINFKESDAYIEDLRKSGLSSVYVQIGGHLPDVIKANALFSTFSRRSKGIFTDGMSSQTDFENGGGLSAFLRIHTKNSQKNLNWYTSVENKPALVFSPNIFKRLDCYCYSSDKFGSLNPDTFQNRVGPKKLTEIMNASYTSSNEIMFHNSVALDKYLRYIVCKNPEGLKKELLAQGIHHIGNTPIEKMIISESEFQKIDFIA